MDGVEIDITDEAIQEKIAFVRKHKFENQYLAGLIGDDDETVII